MFPRPFKWILLTVLCAATIPPALIARVRAMNSREPRVHLIQDMDNQPKFRAQHASLLFKDGRAMRPQVAGTIARGELEEDDHLNRGVSGGKWATSFPPQMPVTVALLERGRERYNIYCQPCHGAAGHGDGMVNQRAMELLNLSVNGTAWVQTKSLHEQLIREQPVGQVFNSITNGVRTMPAYGAQISVEDRWAIVGYVRALQRSQGATINDVPDEQRSVLQRRGS